MQVYHYDGVHRPEPTPVMVHVPGSTPVLPQRAVRAQMQAPVITQTLTATLPGHTSRKAWKKSSPVIGKAGGALLLALAGLAILGAIFVVFSLME